MGELALSALSEGNNPLTTREREVLSASLFGASLTEIAARLILSEGTVRNHLSTAMQKLGAQNRMEAARLAEQKGWLLCPFERVTQGFPRTPTTSRVLLVKPGRAPTRTPLAAHRVDRKSSTPRARREPVVFGLHSDTPQGLKPRSF